jgi:lipoprotein-anchoring transpeptidase ErfK/SrfK
MIATILGGRGLVRLAIGLAIAASLAACVEQEPLEELPPPEPVFLEGYGPIEDDGYHLPGIPLEYLEGANHKVLILYPGDEEPGTIEVDPFAKFLYYVLDDGTALRYPIAVGHDRDPAQGGMARLDADRQYAQDRARGIRPLRGRHPWRA